MIVETSSFSIDFGFESAFWPATAATPQTSSIRPAGAVLETLNRLRRL